MSDWASLGKSILDLIPLFLRKKKKTSDVLKDSVLIRIISESVIETGVVDCFFLMMAHNGGKKLIPHGFKYRSVVGGDYTEWLMPNFEMNDYRNVPLDREYEQLLITIYEKKMHDVLVERMDSTPLSISYRFERLKYVRFYFVEDNEHGMWYIMAGTTQIGEEMDDITHRHILQVAVNKIKNIIKRY